MGARYHWVPNLLLLWRNDLLAPTLHSQSSQHITVESQNGLITIIHASSVPTKKKGGRTPLFVAMSDFRDMRYRALSKLCSDHSPLVGWTITIPRPRNVPFKFFKIWTTDPSLKELMLQSWFEPIEGHSVFVLTQKLKRLKGDLKRRNQNIFGNLGTKVREESEVLEIMQKELKRNFTDALANDLINQENKVKGLLEQEESFWRQKSKTKFLWSAEVLPRTLGTGWKILHGAMHTDEKLRGRKFQLASHCCICTVAEETQDHILFECRFAQRCWELIAKNMQHQSKIANREDMFIKCRNESHLLQDLWKAVTITCLEK
ncbi:hypothetical protein IFM89_010164 [Coptis chinensis]|uniref:Reverse transcriptase zinc-binding domain-containing protein n=1 Tax=Coptis chinensis TaxID=261450 RepID=A0A835IC97_9MAGN|nr:hypothetical protein IFM89_010164 [Coptis chinensis]